MSEAMTGRVLGINGLGRIGKLSVWYHLNKRHFDGLVVNTGREVGGNLEHICDVLASDSTYGSLARFLGGVGKPRDIQIIDQAAGLIRAHGMPVRILLRDRNPKDIGWRSQGVRLVVDTTGAFADPSLPADSPRGSLRGHLEAGAEKVINSAPFKIKDKSKKMPDDSTMLIFGINHRNFDPKQHHVLSAASCTTTGLAHMMKPLMEAEETSRILTASMSTIHAATNTQSVLDSVPKAGATDLRKNRAAMNNIILSTTGAAKALEKVLPEIVEIGFMADSVRVPTQTVSLINLNVTFHAWLDTKGDPSVSRAFINELYRKAAEGQQRGLLVYTDRQNVSADLSGEPAAVVIEGHENHTRTGFVDLPADVLRVQGIDCSQPVRIPVTHAKLFGWYDNEYGSYTHCLGELTCYVDQSL